MPTRYLRIADIQPSHLVWDETKVDLFRGRYAVIIPTDENGEPSFGSEGKYRASQEITFPNMIIRALTSLWSFEEHVGYEKDEDGNDLGTVDYQLSVDGGTVWLYWNGSWTTAGANDWSNEYDVQDNIASLIFTAGIKQIRVKARLNPDSDNLSSPTLYGIAIHHELDFTPEEDVVRSLFAHLNNILTIETEVKIELGTNAQSFKPPIDPEIITVLGVWNETNDPGRLTNLYLSLNKTLIQTKETGEKIYDQQINMTASQTAGDTIVARLRIHIDLYIAPDADYIIGEIPKITIEVGDFTEDMDFRNDGKKIEKNKAKSKARIRKQPKTYRMPVRVISYSPDELLASEINRAVNRVLTDKHIVSLATSEELKIVNEADEARANVIREDLSAKIYEASIVFQDPILDGEYEEVPLVETFTTIIDQGGAR